MQRTNDAAHGQEAVHLVAHMHERRPATQRSPSGQIVEFERRTSAVGRDTISHPDRGHDDVANAVAGAAALSKFGLRLDSSNRNLKMLDKPGSEAASDSLKVAAD